MDIFNTDGIVLKVRHTGESDRIVTVLTREYGVINAFAKSARRPKSKLHAGTQSFCFSDFSFSRSGDTYKITEAAVKEVFYDLNLQIASLALAQYLGQIAVELVAADDSNPENLRLILNSIHFLCSGKKSPAMLKAITEFRLCVNAGYAPELTACCKCGEEPTGGMTLDCADGVLLCKKCASFYSGIPLTAPVLSALRHIAYSDFEYIYSFALNGQDMQLLSEVCEKYLLLRTERSYTALDFYKSLSE